MARRGSRARAGYTRVPGQWCAVVKRGSATTPGNGSVVDRPQGSCAHASAVPALPVPQRPEPIIPGPRVNVVPRPRGPSGLYLDLRVNGAPRPLQPLKVDRSSASATGAQRASSRTLWVRAVSSRPAGSVRSVGLAVIAAVGLDRRHLVSSTYRRFQRCAASPR